MYFFRRTFMLALLVIVPIVSTQTASADAVTRLYEETGLNNKEQMRWIFECASLNFSCSGSPAGQTAWETTIIPQGGIITLISRHLDGPHSIDSDPAEPVVMEVEVVTLTGLPLDLVNPVFTVVATRTAMHGTTGNTIHQDLYELSARRTERGFDFILMSKHVPEPTTMLLLATGLAGVVVKKRKRFRNRSR